MLDRVTGMQVFVRVAAQGSFSAAARALSLSQTMVTKHVAALEERLGVKLLHRSTRRLTLTEAGRHYLASCERILADIEEAETSARADQLEARGTLRLNVPLSFGFREIAVKIAGNLRAGNGDALVAAALAGQGLILQPTFLVADHLRAGRLVALTLDQPTRILPIHAILPSGRQPPAKVRAFVEFLARRFKPDPPWDRGLTALEPGPA